VLTKLALAAQVNLVYKPCPMGWMVAVTQPRRELVAKQFVESQGRITYFPMYRDFATDIIRPLFPNYLFVYDTDGLWRFLRNTFGIITLIMRGGKPDLMKDEIMNSLRVKERDGIICLNEFHSGDKIKIVGSVFDRWDGIYLGMNSQGRCRIMLTMLGQHVPVAMELKNIRAAVV
jgi:transcription antitermination factor NusG